MIDKEYIKTIDDFYAYSTDAYMFDEEGDPRCHLIRRYVSTLPPAERVIFLIYMDQGSEEKTGRMLGCSRTPVHKVVRRIKDSLRLYLEENKDEW